MEPARRRSSQRLQEKPRPKGNTTAGSRRTTRTSRLHVKRKTPVYTSSSEEQVDQLNRRRRPKPKGLHSITTLDPKNDPSPGETSPTNISQPISALVHPALRGAWVINKSVNMCYIFDAVSPAHQFKRGLPFTELATFPDYADGSPGDITETDMKDAPGLMPYMPRDNM